MLEEALSRESFILPANATSPSGPPYRPNGSIRVDVCPSAFPFYVSFFPTFSLPGALCPHTSSSSTNMTAFSAPKCNRARSTMPTQLSHPGTICTSRRRVFCQPVEAQAHGWLHCRTGSMTLPLLRINSDVIRVSRAAALITSLRSQVQA